MPGRRAHGAAGIWLYAWPRVTTAAEDTPPLQLLERWLAQTADAGVGEPRSVAFVIAALDVGPSARPVLLKRLESDALMFTSALWARKANELRAPRFARRRCGAIGWEERVLCARS